ncbi:MAG: tyrosinase [Solirubrobacteraceae bacterium]|nr:tyrosinase [Solirubrobacteraceae bacterium]
MPDDAGPSGPIANPTYMADIRNFFTPDDVNHMAPKGYDLATYDGVKDNASDIYGQTQAGNMPPPPAEPWSADKVQTFLNWMTNGFALGSATAPVVEPSSPTNGVTASRVRKNVASLSDEELTTLKAAFTGLMARDPSDPGSYYALAGIHWLPGGWDGVNGRCQHHINGFNPWHRVFLKGFEDALRTVPGCEEVTLPYWDISTPLPDPLREEPFASYTLQEDPAANIRPNPGYFPGSTTRYTPEEIEANLVDRGFASDTATSLQQSRWGVYSNSGPATPGNPNGGSGYQQFSIQAHDSGHVSIGDWMANQDIAAFDPVFWFYHCNLDRLWLQWQRNAGAETLIGFKSTLGANTAWLSPPINGLSPFSPPALTPATTTDETIEFGISYDDQDLESVEELALENTTGSIDAARSFSIKSTTPVSVRVKNIDRLNIPGSFDVHLLADGKVIAKRALFQPTSPRDCETCKSVALISLDFRIEQEKLLDKQLSVEIHVPGHKDIGTKFPLSKAGNPTINARLLLHEE